MPRFVCWLLAALLLPAAALANPVKSMEQGLARLGKTRMAGREVTVVQGKRFSVWLRPGGSGGVIGVTRGRWGLRQQGFFLGAEGRLSAADHATLLGLIEKHAPGTTAGGVEHAIGQAVRDFERHQLELSGEDALIDDLLARAGSARGRDTVLWQGRRGRLTYRPGSNLLVGEGRLSQRGFFFDDPGMRDALREFLHSRK